MRRQVPFAAVLLLAILRIAAAPVPFRFAILGDRTGDAQPGVYERIWREATATNPAFVVTVGDTIEGGSDSTAAIQWQQWQQLIRPYRIIPVYLTPGNHDIWSPRSEALFQQYSGHPPHYSFDYQQAHFTIVDNSRSEQFSSAELQFLESDLRSHTAQPLKFVISHRPSWLIDSSLGNTASSFHQLMKRYGVHYVVAGHVHQLIHAKLEGISYVSLPSSGGHLRSSSAYRDGWFFGYSVVEVDGSASTFQIHELGSERVTTLDDWGILGLIGEKIRAAAAWPILRDLCTRDRAS